MTPGSWNLIYEGRATDYMPERLRALGSPGTVASVARDAIWEAVQAIATRDSAAWVRVTVGGWETQENPDHGQFQLNFLVTDEPSQISLDIDQQQPIDLRT